ncbi:MAG: LPS export ABC transporter permease LptG [Dissulfuribacterales bacterium]
MTIIHSYITRMFFKYFGIVLGMVIIIYLSIDFFGKIDKFIKASTTTTDIIAYFLYKIPLIMSQITPVAVLMSVLVVFGLMAKNNEIIALKSGGVSLYYLLLPVMIIGMCLSLLLFIFSEALVPISIVKAHQIRAKKTQAKKMMASRGKNIWIRGDQSITHIQYYNPSDQTVFGISIVYFDDSFGLKKRINAKKGRYGNGKWVLNDCMIQDFSNQDNDQQTNFYDEKSFQLNLLPSDLQQVAVKSEEMSFSRLLKYIRKIESQGYDATKYRVDLYAKTAFPFICLILSLFGSGLALRGSTKDGMVISFAYGIITAFIYWSFYSFCLSLGYGNILPPLLAAWIANLIFFCAAGLAIYNLE